MMKSACSEHFNYKSMHESLIIALQYGSNHSCDHNKELTYKRTGKNYKFHCNCLKCVQCSNIIKILQLKDPNQLFKYLCCENNQKYPNRECLTGD